MHKFEITDTEGGAAFPVVVRPNAKATQLTGKSDELVYIDLAAVSERDAIDKALVDFLATKLDVGIEKIAIAAGKSIEKKMVIVMGLTPEQIEVRLFG